MSCGRKSLITHTATKLLACGLFFGASLSHAAEEIILISTVSADSGWELPLERKRPYGAITASRGDQIVLQTSGLKRYAFFITDARKSNLGNSIIRGRGNGGGRSLFVIDPNGHVKGHFVDSDEMVQLTTDDFGVTTAWREGIDTVPVPFKCEVENPPDAFWPAHKQSQGQKPRIVTPVQASKLSVEEEEPVVRYARYATGHATVRVLIYYDSTMEGYIERLADFLIETTNDAFSDSKVNMSLELASMLPIEWDATLSTRDAMSLMYDQLAPYENIESDRQEYSAALVASLVDEDGPGGDDDSWGRATLGGQFLPQRYSITRSWRYAPGEEFYSDDSFAHEIGHNLGLNHNREEYPEEDLDSEYTFSYAYGFYEADTHRTIMSYNTFGYVPGIYLYSNPNITKDGFKLGRSFLDPEAADASRALFNNRHPAEARNGQQDNISEFAMESVSIYESECFQQLEEGDEKGEARVQVLSLRSGSGARINSSHRIRSDGSASVYRYPSNSTYASEYDCRLPDEGLNSLGTEYVESFFRYVDPNSGELVESAHVFWEEDMEGDYSHIRVAHTDGGRVVGNTSLLLKEGSEHTVEFNADYGFKLTDIESSCDGRRAGNSYIVFITSDDCRVEAKFGKGDTGTIAQDNFSALLSVIQGLGQPTPEPIAKDQFIGTYHVFRPQRPGREGFIRISADQSLALDSDRTVYRWEINGNELDAYWMYQPDDPSGDYHFSLSQDPVSGRIEAVDSYYTSSNWDFYGEQKSTDSEFDFDLYELGRDWFGDEQHVLKCFNIGRRENSFYSTDWYSDSQLPATSTDLEECRSYCPAILEDYQERDPDAWADRVCEGDESQLDGG